MIKMERLGPISVHYGQKLADNYWKPKIKEAQKFGKKHIFSEFTELYLLIYGPCLKFFVQLLLYLNFSFN